MLYTRDLYSFFFIISIIEKCGVMKNIKYILSICICCWFFILIFSDLVILEEEEEKNDLKILEQSTVEESYIYPIVDTNQITSYDNLGSVIDPFPEEGDPFFGQDAETVGNTPTYLDNGDGTITDLVTGLIWQQDPGEKMSWDNVVAGASSFNLAGFDDWRFPSIKELYSLIIFTGVVRMSAADSIPFIDTDYFTFEYGDESKGERLIDSQYWTSTEYVSTTMYSDGTVFGVNFADGRIKGYPKEMPGGSDKELFVIYVRGNIEYGINNFVDNTDGTISDNATGLMWSKADSGTGMNWEDALAWVQTKNTESYLGNDDWRLPNIKELQSIVNYSRSPDTTDSAAIDPIFETTKMTTDDFPYDNGTYGYYWSSTSHFSGTGADHASYIAFGEALGYMNYSGEMILQDVHGAGCQRSDPKSGDPTDSKWEYGHGPQGDIIHINNFVRLVRENPLSTYDFEDDSPQDGLPPEIPGYNLIILIGVSVVIISIIIKKKIN